MPHPMKDRWESAELLAGKLGVRKSEVFNVYTDIEAKGLIPRILADEPEAIEEARQMTTRHFQAAPPRKKRFPLAHTPLEKTAQDLRLMLWTISKIGDVRRAEIAFKHASAALRETETE